MPGNGATRFDPRELLCERCGYSIEGLDEEGDCPECGERIWESLPERRVGSAWQRAERVDRQAAARTIRELLSRPHSVLRAMRIEPDARVYRLAEFLRASTMVLACWIVFPVVVASLMILYVTAGRFGGFLELLLPVLVAAAGVWLLPVLVFPALLLLTGIEARGLRFLGARHGYRISPEIAWTVCTHASVGWAIGLTMVTVSGVLMSVLVGLDGPLGSHPRGVVPIGVFHALAVGSMGVLLVGTLGGFLLFEWLAWTGMRRCKFANMPREHGEGSAIASSAGPSALP